MEDNRRNSGSIVGGVILIVLGLLALSSQWLGGFNFWGSSWPFIIIAVGIMFFVGMFVGGKSGSGLAIPGSIVTTVGLILFVQNLTNRWESWSYAWTLIVISVGLGIYIAGQYSGNEDQRQAGVRVLLIGVAMFVVFGVFFGMLFYSYNLSKYAVPALLILLGIFLLVSRMGILPGSRRDAHRES